MSICASRLFSATCSVDPVAEARPGTSATYCPPLSITLAEYSLPPTVIVKLLANAAAAALEIETVAAPPCDPPLDAGFCDALALLGAAAGALVVEDVFAVDAVAGALVLDDVFVVEAAGTLVFDD